MLIRCIAFGSGPPNLGAGITRRKSDKMSRAMTSNLVIAGICRVLSVTFEPVLQSLFTKPYLETTVKMLRSQKHIYGYSYEFRRKR